MDVGGQLVLFKEMQPSNMLSKAPAKTMINSETLFAFDNAKSHTNYAPKTLVAKNMNLSSAKKQEKMQSTLYFHRKIKYNQKAQELMSQQPDFLAQKEQ
ncbi:9473_t:CDS:2 [Gigaspora margarita]|uniref:9473_t:CDS:1 n=1 Tax=Gigaspora margarita TaxID=4874 RepID=A0ABN7UKV6_GIGMA|nr:9473_t:CDS:2 [Gigaspora margarita]